MSRDLHTILIDGDRGVSDGPVGVVLYRSVNTGDALGVHFESGLTKRYNNDDAAADFVTRCDRIWKRNLQNAKYQTEKELVGEPTNLSASDTAPQA